MALERSIVLPQSAHETSNTWRGSRREVVKQTGKLLSGAFVMGAVGTGWRYRDEAIDMLEAGSSREEFDRYIKEEGFNPVDKGRSKELLGDVTSFLDIESYASPSGEPDGLTNVTFRLEEPTFVVATVEGIYDEIGSLPVVTATTSFSDFEYVVPILQTRYEKSQTFALKSLPPGEHNMQFRKTNSSDTLGNAGISVSVKTPDNVTPFGMTMLNSLPVLGMQKEFAHHGVYNDDAPFFRTGKLYERKSDKKVRVAFFEGRTSENGGIGEDPREMNKELHRLYDFDHSVILTIGADDALLEEVAHQEDRIRAHRIITDVVYPFGVDPQKVQEQFYYHSVPAHGMVKRGLERGSDGDLISNVYSLYPEFYTPLGKVIEEERFRVRKLVAVREQKREHEREMGQLAEMYQSLFTPENFPEQFETAAFLHDEEERLTYE